MILVLTFVMTATCLAMNFSQPEKIGDIGGTPIGGFEIRGASDNNGTIYQNNRWSKKWGTLYAKGIARFGDGLDALYVHYNCTDWRGSNYRDAYSPKFGNKSATRTISLQAGEGDIVSIYRVKNTGNFTLYLLSYHGCVGGAEQYILFKVMQDGNFAELLDSRSIIEKYVGVNRMHMRGIYLSEPYFFNDTMIIKYTDFNSNLKKRIEIGEFRFKWDDKAQWFGVEQIIY